MIKTNYKEEIYKNNIQDVKYQTFQTLIKSY
jgi:hypothetical protein